MYIKLSDSSYPHSEDDIRAAFPNVSFPDPFVAPPQYANVFPAPQPAFDPMSQSVREIPPELTQLGTWEQRFEVVALPDDVVSIKLAAAKAAQVKQIDTDADAIYRDVMGNRATEYNQAYVDATNYKNAGYTGPVPGYVQAWADAKSQTAQWAADDILATAAGWNAAQAAIRQNRLLRKEQTRNAADSAALATAKSQWNGFVAYIRGQLGV